MKRRKFCKGIVLVPASGALVSITRLAESATPEQLAQAVMTRQGNISGLYGNIGTDAIIGTDAMFIQQYSELLIEVSAQGDDLSPDQEEAVALFLGEWNTLSEKLKLLILDVRVNK